MESMKRVVQSHFAATISTGGAAKCVSVPPTETLTNSTPSVAYLRRLGRIGREDAIAQHQRGERHRRRLGDERAEQRHEREAQEIAGDRRARGDARRRRLHAVGRELHDGPARRDDHDHEDEHRLDEVRPVQVGRGRAPAVGERHEHQQHERPEAEHGLDFAQQVPQARVRSARVREMLEVARREGVQDRQREQRGADDLEQADVGGHARSYGTASRGRQSQRRVSKITYLPRPVAARKMRSVQ